MWKKGRRGNDNAPLIGGLPLKPSALSFLYALSLVFIASSLAAAEAGLPGFAVESDGIRLAVRPQSSEEAYDYLLRTLDQMSFFDANGYDVALPSHAEFDAEGEIGSLQSFAEQVYREADFQRAMAVLGEGKPKLEQALRWFSTVKGEESFQVPAQYTVVLTLYGPGGSYDPATGTITMLTTLDGEFRGGGGAHTIVHEMMHIAVEESLVRRFSLSHWEKERLVDVLCQRELSHVLPDYRLQPLGDQQLGEAISDSPLSDLVEALTAYRNRRPSAIMGGE